VRQARFSGTGQRMERQATTQRPVHLPVVLAVAVTVLCWSSNFPTIRYILQVYDPISMSVLRTWVGALALAALALALRLRLPALRDWPLCVLFGLTGIALATLCLNYGLSSLSAGGGAFLIGTVPIFSALLAWGCFGERLSRRAWLGIAVSFAGVGLIGLGEGGGLRFDLGTLFILASAANQAFFYVFQRLLHRRYSSLQITCTSVWAGAVLLSAFAPGLPALVARAPLGHTLAVVYLGIFPTAIAFTAWNFALSRARAAKVTSSLFAMPALAIAMAFAWLGEVPTLLSVLGGAVALSGVAMVHLWGGKGEQQRQPQMNADKH
jgi:drug/metabolite transporter (DMT)-like permease